MLAVHSVDDRTSVFRHEREDKEVLDAGIHEFGVRKHFHDHPGSSRICTLSDSDSIESRDNVVSRLARWATVVWRSGCVFFSSRRRHAAGTSGSGPGSFVGSDDDLCGFAD